MSTEFPLVVPTTSGDLSIDLGVGDVLFLLGANGSGKSSLVTRFYAAHQGRAKRISAHRQTWFQSNSLDMTPASRVQTEQNIRGQDAADHSRHRLYAPAERTSMAIFDLIDADTMLSRLIADYVRQKRMPEAEEAASRPSPLAVINQFMSASNMPIEISVQEGQKIMACKQGGTPYSVAELSDGERNAFLIAADVLTAKPDSLVVIDEPERHLHRSIISPLLTMLFSYRADCAFIISTHELPLPLDNPTASTLLVRSCVYEGSAPKAWSVDYIPSDIEIDESVKLDLLGGRRKILFIEGTPRSLDAPIYALLFPGVSIIPRITCKEVEVAVRGLRGASEMHWVHVWGIVDRDQRPDEEITRLTAAGVHALPFYSVEALYYHPSVIEQVAQRFAALTGGDPSALRNAAVQGAFKKAVERREHFVLGAVERLARRQLMASFPSRADLKNQGSFVVEIDTPALIAAQEGTFDRLVAEGDWAGLLEIYPLRQSGSLDAIAAGLGFRSRSDYERAVRAVVGEEERVREFLQSLFGSLGCELLDKPVAV